VARGAGEVVRGRGDGERVGDGVGEGAAGVVTAGEGDGLAEDAATRSGAAEPEQALSRAQAVRSTATGGRTRTRVGDRGVTVVAPAVPGLDTAARRGDCYRR
jgi:hypothetical protein